MRTITVLWKGLEIAVPITYFSKGYPMPVASTPDCPGYDDTGDPGEVEFEDPILVSVDCSDTFLEFLNLQDNEDFIDTVFTEMNDASSI